MNNQKSLQVRVVEFLRDEYEKDRDGAMFTASQIAYVLGVDEAELYDRERETGLLDMLQNRGKVRRIGNYEYYWKADGAKLVWT